MKKINDWFIAGLIAGIIGGMGLLIFNLGALLLGVPTGTYWQAVGGLFYNNELIKHLINNPATNPLIWKPAKKPPWTAPGD